LLGSSIKKENFIKRSHHFQSSTKEMTPYHKAIVPVEDVETVELIARTLDSLFPESLVPYVDYLSIDCEGSDLDVLRGGTKLLERTSLVSVEIVLKELYVGQPLFDEVREWMSKHGFECSAVLWWTQELGDGYFERRK
jgi:hypothetical protein